MPKVVFKIPNNLKLFTSFHLFLLNCQLDLDCQTCQVVYAVNRHHSSQLKTSRKQSKSPINKILVQFNNGSREVVEVSNFILPIKSNDTITLLIGKRQEKDHHYNTYIAIYSHDFDRYSINNRYWSQLFYSSQRKILGFCLCFILLLIIMEIIKNSLLSFGVFFLPSWLWAIWAVNTEVIKFKLTRHIEKIYSQGKIHSPSSTVKILNF